MRREASCEESFRVGKHFVRRDASYEEMLLVGKHFVRRDASSEETLRMGKHFVRRDASCEETLRERNHFVCFFVLEKTRTTINAALWGIWNGCVSFQTLSINRGSVPSVSYVFEDSASHNM